MRLHENEELFKQLIALAAEFVRLDQSQVEKDYWITKVLRDIADSPYAENAYFKGGTSLQKAYGLIDRFSEDLDIYVDTNRPGIGGDPEKALNSRLYHYLLEHNMERHVEDDPDAKDITGGDFRKLYLKSNVIFPAVGLKQYLQIESMISAIKAKTEVYHPAEKKTVQSFIGQYLDSIGSPLTSQFGLEPFGCWCISPKETVCDKISRLARLSQKQDNVAYAEHVRDFYDIHHLVSDKEIKAFLESDEFLEAMYLTNNQDWLQHKNPHTRQPYATCRVFSNPRSVMEDQIVNEAYDNLHFLLFRHSVLPDMEEVIGVLEWLSTILAKFDDYRQARESGAIMNEDELEDARKETEEFISNFAGAWSGQEYEDIEAEIMETRTTKD